MKHSRPLILLALSALLPLILLSALLGAAWLHQQQADMERAALDHVRHGAAVIERELAAQIQVLLVLAQSPLFDRPLPGRPLPGRPLPGQAEDGADVAAGMERARRQVPLWQILSLSDRNGLRLIDRPEPIGGRSGPVVDIDSHARAVATAAPVIGGIRRGSQDRAAFAVRVPILHDGAVTHVLSAVVRPDTVAQLLRDNVPKGWRGSVVDSEGRLVARTFGDPALIGRPASDDVRAARARGGEGLYQGVSLEGEQLAGAYRMLPDWNWSVHIAMPRAAYYAPLRTSQWLLAAGALGSLTLAGSFLLLLWREAETRRRAEAALESGRRMEALGRMTGGVAHDFNNLLMIAQGGAEGIKRRVDDPDRVTAYADAILTAVQRGAALTRQLLAFARRSPQAPVAFRLQERTAELLPLLERSTRSDIATSLSVPDDLWPIFADPDALELALVNLAVNARDAMPDGGSLSVGAANVTLDDRRGEPVELRGDHVAIRVRDSGTGIAAENLDRVFEPFYTSKAPDRGTGLGLSQVLGFARQSNGAVTVDSTVGVGTTFTLFLPRAPEAARTAGATAAGMDDPEPHPGTIPGAMAVLLVEDSPEVARATESMLTAAGCSVAWAADGFAALERIERGERFDAVVSDIMLNRGPSGLELVPLLRRHRPGLPVVLMTGYSEALSRGIPDGLTVLHKPVGQAELSAALGAAIAAAGTVPAAQG